MLIKLILVVFFKPDRFLLEFYLLDWSGNKDFLFNLESKAKALDSILLFTDKSIYYYLAIWKNKFMIKIVVFYYHENDMISTIIFLNKLY